MADYDESSALNFLMQLAQQANPDPFLQQVMGLQSAPYNMRAPTDFQNPQTMTPIADQVFGPPQMTPITTPLDTKPTAMNMPGVPTPTGQPAPLPPITPEGPEGARPGSAPPTMPTPLNVGPEQPPAPVEDRTAKAKKPSPKTTGLSVEALQMLANMTKPPTPHYPSAVAPPAIKNTFNATQLMPIQQAPPRIPLSLAQMILGGRR